MATESKQPTRRALTRELVVDTALATADANGLEAVSFRRLATELGVTPMALYRYVSSKEELFGAIVDRAFEEFEFPADSDADWRERLRDLARAFRRLLLTHPAAAALYFTRTDAKSLGGLRIIEIVLGVLEDAGFSREQAAMIEGELERNVVALIVFETSRAALWESDEDREARIREIRARMLALPPDEFPRVVGAADYLCGPADPNAAFEFALDLMIGGLEQLLRRQ